MAEKLLNIMELSIRFHVSKASMYKIVKRAGFPKPIMITASLTRGKRVWSESAVDQWILNQAQR